jgi:ubiquinone/menaquinone biosynthesis C-methylase UbiE
MAQAANDTYRWVAKYYDRLLEPMNAPLRPIAFGLCPTDDSMTVLDVGCGTGALLEAYVASGAECVGIDASPAMLNQATARLGEAADLDLGDATALPYEDASFDLVFTSLFLHELAQDAQLTVLTEMARVARPDGRVLVIDYRAGSLRMKGHVRRTISTVAERVAGRDHYKNWRGYLSSGGLPTLLPRTVLTVEREKIVAGGNLALWLLREDR